MQDWKDGRGRHRAQMAFCPVLPFYNPRIYYAIFTSAILSVFYAAFCCLSVSSITHNSLLRLTSEEGLSDLHNERSCADDHSESIVHPWSSSTCCIQVFLGRPSGRFHRGQGICPDPDCGHRRRIVRCGGRYGPRWSGAAVSEWVCYYLSKARSCGFSCSNSSSAMIPGSRH